MKPIQLFKSVAIATSLLLAGSAGAQMVGGSIFLKGNYVEAGICDNGDFGAATPPAGYHPHPASAKLGFVADPAMDGWTTGTPAYMGDYFTPGSPFEGWNIQIGSIRSQAHSCAGFVGAGLTGANVSYAVSGSKLIANWEGSFDSMTVRQVTTLDTLGLYFSLRITLINMASVAKNNIYYLRSLDPDNNQSWPGGGFGTNNRITHQLPNPANATVVTATSASGPASHLSLGTTDTNARAIIYNSWPISTSTDLATIFSGAITSTVAYFDTVNHPGDIAIGLAFRVAHLAPLDSASDSVGMKPTATTALHPANEASFTYFYAFSAAAVDSAIADLIDTATTVPQDTTIIPPPPTVVKNVNTTSEVKVYPNPTGNIINIAGLNATDRLQLYDMMGRNMSGDWQVHDRAVNTFSMQMIPTGSYLLIVTDEHGRTKAQVPLRKQ